jgi:molybdate transport system ATP-binding protein
MSLTVDIKKKLAQFDLEVSFEVGRETMGLLGASGCGKTMTLRCIAGVEMPDEGRIVLNGHVLFDSAAKVNLTPQQRKTALLFQNYQLFPNFTVAQNIAAGVDPKLPASERRRLVARQVQCFSLHGLERRYPLHLSGGQQQRVALARMLAAQPGILMLDEPFSALDSHLKSQLEQDLLNLFDTYEGPILYVSHDIDEAFRFCDRIAVEHAGHLCETGPVRQVVDHPATLAGLHLSGCRNISRARRAGTTAVRAEDWGVTLQTDGPVPDGLAYVGIRSSFLRPADAVCGVGTNTNVFEFTVGRVAEGRFEYEVLVRASDAPADSAPLVWRIDALHTNDVCVPHRGQRVLLSLNPAHLHLVSA